MVDCFNDRVRGEPDWWVGEEFILIRVYVEFADRVTDRGFHRIRIERNEIDGYKKIGNVSKAVTSRTPCLFVQGNV